MKGSGAYFRAAFTAVVLLGAIPTPCALARSLTTDVLDPSGSFVRCERLLSILRKLGAPTGAIRPSQRDLYRGIYFDLDRTNRLDEKAETNLYETSAKYGRRSYENRGTFGASYDAESHTTRIATFGDPDRISKLEVVISETADPSKSLERQVAITMHQVGDKRWVADVPGNVEGKWYHFHVESRERASSSRSVIPREFNIPDITSPKISRFGTSQVYYWPDPSLRPAKPVISGPLNLLELDLLSIQPPDVPKELWGTPAAVIQSQIMRDMIASFDGVELLPIRNSEWVELVDPAHPHIYAHYWGYMPKDYSISIMRGGAEGLIELVDWMHSQGKVVVEDSVLQHTANDMKAFQWMLGDAYLDHDITGCGNTVNSEPGSVPAQIMLEMQRRNLEVIGFDGTRFDLFGAIHRDTAQALTDLSISLGGFVAGEPYAYPFDQSRWTNYSNPIRRAGLWDHELYGRIRSMARQGASSDELLGRLLGDQWNWYASFSDRTVIAETHDGQTLASAMGGDLKRVALATMLQMSMQGGLLFGPGQAIAFRDEFLDNKPVQLFDLSNDQNRFLQFFKELLGLRTKYRGYFAFPSGAVARKWVKTLGAQDLLTGQRSSGSAGLLFEGPAPGSSAADHGELAVLMNFSDHDVRFELSGTPSAWNVLGDSSQLAISDSHSLYPPADKGEYIVHPFSIVWLGRAR